MRHKLVSVREMLAGLAEQQLKGGRQQQSREGGGSQESHLVYNRRQEEKLQIMYFIISVKCSIIFLLLFMFIHLSWIFADSLHFDTVFILFIHVFPSFASNEFCL